MLQLKNISKTYKTGDFVQKALENISVSFRKKEFVAILGQSGSGKTTMLNIIGGLDRYDSGDLYINGISTKQFKDKDWDAYRNHSVGFVFQSYNLIPHQTILANVELALTLSGVSKSERRSRAKQALADVGLGDQIHKKPNQLSGGQMQRVAIARALVNNPDILLADEPTGALDSETSIQVMNIMEKVAEDRLVIMVTHNPELAEKYANRIINVADGHITGDTNPISDSEMKQLELEEKAENEKKAQKGKTKGKGKRESRTSMSFLTALSLSLNNLMTKKTRTMLTAFAGSIGIIGIALIQSVSTGFKSYINRVQEDTLSSYPISILAEEANMSELITTLMGNNENNGAEHELDAVYSSPVMYDLVNSINSVETNKNNLNAFRSFIESNDDIKKYTTAIQYKYDLDMNIFTEDPDGKIVKSDLEPLMKLMGMSGSSMASSSSMMSASYMPVVWEEMLSGDGDKLINDLLEVQYDVVYGSWPKAYNEVVLIVNENNEISDFVLYALGLKSYSEMEDIINRALKQEQIDTDNLGKWSYEDICGKTFKLILSSDMYQKQADGTYINLSETDAGLSYLFDNQKLYTELKITGIVKASGDAVSSMMSGAIGYTSALTDYVLSSTSEKDIVKAQLENPDTDIISGLPFKNSGNVKELTDSEKAAAVKEYISSLSYDERIALYRKIASIPSDEYLESAVNSQLQTMTRSDLEQTLISAYAKQMGISDTSTIEEYVKAMDDETLISYISEAIKEAASAEYASQIASMSDEEIVFLFEGSEHSLSDYAKMYDLYMPSSVSDSTYEDNLSLLGYVDTNTPSGINLYSSTFEDKEKVADIITKYNGTVDDKDKITYTDYIALLLSSVSTIIDAISYVLIAFVSISLIVSAIMISVITYISVLERTKEIGILRSVGASKHDVTRVFNAETFIIGTTAGVLGVAITLLLLIPVNIILHSLTGIEILSAQLTVDKAVLFILVSMILTIVAGLVPSLSAAKKDPVVALRTE